MDERIQVYDDKMKKTLEHLAADYQESVQDVPIPMC